MEKALLHILRRNQFTGSEDVSVFAVGPAPTPIYILTLGGDVANVLGDLLLAQEVLLDAVGHGVLRGVRLLRGPLE
jgi:hypothetical protein